MIVAADAVQQTFWFLMHATVLKAKVILETGYKLNVVFFLLFHVCRFFCDAFLLTDGIQT